MIKVNLLKQSTRGQTALTQTTQTTQSRFTGVNVNPDLRKKIIVLLLPITSVFIYDSVNIFNYKSDLKGLEKKAQDLKAKTTALQPQIDESKKLQEEKKSLTEKIELLKGLSLKRYRTLKIFDALQSLLPNKAWLMKLDILEDQIAIEGHASEDLAISGFMEALEQSAYFKDVTWVDSHEVKQDKGDTVKFFKIKLSMEKL